MKFKASFAKFLTNKTALNIVFVIALINVIGYLMIGNIQAVVLFILSALSISYFSKNMIIVLGVSILLTNLFAMRGELIEGFEDSKKVVKKVAEQVMDKETTESDSEKPKVQNGKKKGAHAVDYASTVEEAYDNLNGILGGDGMKNLSEDTKRLMEHQAQLTQSMSGVGSMVEGLAPMIDQLQSMMGKMDKMGGSSGGLADMAKKFSAPKK